MWNPQCLVENSNIICRICESDIFSQIINTNNHPIITFQSRLPNLSLLGFDKGEGVKSMTKTPTENADPSSFEFTVSRPTAGEPAWSQTRCPTRVTVCVSWTICGTPESGTKIYSKFIRWLFGATLYGGVPCSASMQGEVLVLSLPNVPGRVDSPQKALPFLGAR